MEEKEYKILVINKENNYLHNVCDPVATIAEGEDIAKDLFRVLTDGKKGVGLAANQIGIPKRVCVVNVKEPLYFINPKITPVEEQGKFVYLETCLSMPGIVARTERWRSILIEADNIEGKDYYDISNIPQDLVMSSNDAYEMAAIQHEIDHLDGIIMTQRKYHSEPFHVLKEHERNDKIIIAKGLERKEIKFKKFDEYKQQGWTIVE